MASYLSLTRRRALWLGLGSLAGLGVTVGKALEQRNLVQAIDRIDREFSVVGTTSLKERAAAKGLIYGADSHGNLFTDPTYTNTFIQECGLLVGGSLKWYLPPSPLRPSPDVFDFSVGDEMVRFAQKYKLLLRGHTLIWHLSLPPWFEEIVNVHNAEQFLVQHVETVVNHFAGTMHSWDVVNEAIEVSDGRADGLRNTPWLQRMGPEYIELAFRVAAAADPQAMLVYNDYGLEYNSRNDDAKRAAVLNLLERLKSQGTPIHALGIQGHLFAHETNFNPEKFRKFLADVASLDLKILITELDVSDRKLPADPQLRDRIVASVYEDFLSVTLEEPAVIAVITWGLSDRYTWLSEFEPRSDGLPVRPLPLDENMNRKLAWNAIARAFDRAPVRESS